MPISMKDAVASYIRAWGRMGYHEGIPDTVPDGIDRLNLAPSYARIVRAILSNDPRRIGATLPESPWYSTLKRIELASRDAHRSHTTETDEPSD